MEASGPITKGEEPTKWVNLIVTVSHNEKLRICLDPSDLNKVVKREHCPLCTIEEVVASIPGAQVFSS